MDVKFYASVILAFCLVTSFSTAFNMGNSKIGKRNFKVSEEYFVLFDQVISWVIAIARATF